jgi:hypothetical protein
LAAAREHATITWNYTTWLDLVAIAVSTWFWIFKMGRKRSV